MSLHTAVIGLARSNIYLHALINDRIAVESGIQNWELPYVAFTTINAAQQKTFGNKPNLIIARIEANLYAANGVALDQLEAAWFNAFNRYSGTIGGETITSWITSSYDEDNDLETDTLARSYTRVVEFTVAFVPS